jgi:uncharacterized protein (TIGR02145 family)
MKLAKFLFLPAVLFLLASLCLITCSKKSTDPDNTPVVTTSAVSSITHTSAQCGGTITSDGGKEIKSRGVVYSTNATPTYDDDHTWEGEGTGSFISSLNHLTPGTKYYVRAYADNYSKIGYGEVRSFTTTGTLGSVTDIDGNVYQTVTIGSQVWMMENLKVTHYRNGNEIPNVTSSGTWDGLSTGAYCNYNNEESHVAVYGRLYNWFATVDSRNIAPTGWHVPDSADWQTLIDYLGGEDVAGGKIKEFGTEHWYSPNDGATNECGFTALPGGFRSWYGSFGYMRDYGPMWSSTEAGIWGGCALNLSTFHASVGLGGGSNNKKEGYAIRCVKD